MYRPSDSNQNVDIEFSVQNAFLKNKLQQVLL
jgi:hypothetical protein